MIALVAGLVLVGLAASCFAALLHPRGAVAYVLAVAVCAAAEIVAVSHFLSFFGAYTRGWFLATCTAIAVGAVCTVAVVRPPRPPLPRRAVVLALLGDPAVAVLAAIVAIELGYLLALALFTPPTEYDALTYHLTRALFWIQQSEVSPVPGVTDTRINDLPPDAEILQGGTMLLSGSIRFVGLVQLGALVAAVLAIYGTACRIGLERRDAAFGALLFPTLTVVALQAPAPLNDLVVAALVVIAAFFALGGSLGEIALAGVAIALLVGTKPTGLLCLPVLGILCVLTHRGRRLLWILVAGLAGATVGAAWYILVNVPTGEGGFGQTGASTGHLDGLVPIAARLSRYAVEAFDVPSHGRDIALYGIAAGLVAVGGLALRRRTLAVAGAAALALLPLLVPSFERVMHAVYWHGWTLVGYSRAAALDPIRGVSSASNLASWYGPVGLALTVASLVLVTLRARRGALPWSAIVLASAPVAVLVGMAVGIGYHPFNGRFVMGGVALGAATWGVIRVSPAAGAATVAVAAVTAFLALVNFTERPAGFGVLEPAAHPSIWTLPRAWSQSIQPEVSRMIEYLDARASRGSTIAVTRDKVVYPFAYVGWPRIEHRLVYADTLDEATRGRAAWAVLRSDVACAPAWKLALRSDQWAVFRHVPGASCR